MKRVILAAVTSTLAATLAASPAAGQVPVRTEILCGIVGVCVWQHYSYGGAVEMAFTPPAGTCVNLQRLGNQVTSLYNRSGRTVRFHFDQGCGGNWIEKRNGDWDGNLAINYPWGGNDNIESVRF